MNFEIFCKSLPLPGYEVCGDGYIIVETSEKITVGCIDGLGHGEGANKAAETAKKCIKENHKDDPIEIIKWCHKALRKTVGAAISVLQINLAENRMEFAGIGNVDLRAYSKNDIHPISYTGIVGYNLRKIQSYKYQQFPGDILVLTTDGISTKYEIEDIKYKSAGHLVEYIFNGWYKRTDDGTVIVIKVLAEEQPTLNLELETKD